jgi:hypothetical protein
MEIFGNKKTQKTPKNLKLYMVLCVYIFYKIALHGNI